MTAEELGGEFGRLLFLGVAIGIGFWIARGIKEEDNLVPDIPK